MLVIIPIEKMVNIVKQLADNPFQKPQPQRSNEELGNDEAMKTGAPRLETAVLEETVRKIQQLLQAGFGEVGAEIITENMSSGDGDLNIMTPGRKVEAIFGYCAIQRFSELSDYLQGSVISFVNLVSSITHSCCHEWEGAANKNFGGGYLFVWKIRNLSEMKMNKSDKEGQRASELANKALIAFVKIHAEKGRQSQLMEIEQAASLTNKFGAEFQFEFSLCLHAGWAIEGAVGSEYKIDANYTSPHVGFVEDLKMAVDIYGTNIIMSESFYIMLSSRAKEKVRKIDVVRHAVSGNQPIGIFTFDLSPPKSAAPHDSSRPYGTLILPEDMQDLPIDRLKSSGVEYVFVTDMDITSCQADMGREFWIEYRRGLSLYIEGQWGGAEHSFEKCLALQPKDGPTAAMLKYIRSQNCLAPEGWSGSRVLCLQPPDKDCRS